MHELVACTLHDYRHFSIWKDSGVRETSRLSDTSKRRLLERFVPGPPIGSEFFDPASPAAPVNLA